jgi:hypothetical protein
MKFIDFFAFERAKMRHKKGDGRIEETVFSFEQFVRLTKFFDSMRNSATRNCLVGFLVY